MARLSPYRTAAQPFSSAHRINVVDTFKNIQDRINAANGGEALAAAVADMRALADQGHAGAANNFGTCAQFGRGTPENMLCARHYYGMAAQAGLAMAQFNLGFMWLHGLGGEARPRTAYRWFAKAAAQDEVDALTHMGRMTMIGQGCTADPHAALDYWRRGAALGDGRCAFNLGVACAGGHAGEANLMDGLMWFYIAKRLGADATAAPIAKLKSVLTDIEITTATRQAAVFNGGRP